MCKHSWKSSLLLLLLLLLMMMMMMMMMMNCFWGQLTNGRHFVLFPAGTIPKNSHHHKSLVASKILTCAEPEFSYYWTKSCVVVITTTPRRYFNNRLMELLLRKLGFQKHATLLKNDSSVSNIFGTAILHNLRGRLLYMLVYRTTSTSSFHAQRMQSTFLHWSFSFMFEVQSWLFQLKSSIAKLWICLWCTE